MLILTRRHGESIRIGKDIQIVVCGIHGAEVRIGVDAPRAIPVMRTEVAERVEQKANAKTEGMHDEPARNENE